MNGERVRVWKKDVVAYFKVLSWHSPGEAEENPENYQDNRLRTDPYTYRIHVNMLGGLCENALSTDKDVYR
jgi:hypothetical protein